jgi:hypothetical protein
LSAFALLLSVSLLRYHASAIETALTATCRE